MEGWGTIFILHVFDQVVSMSIGFTAVLPGVGQDELTGVMILVNGEEGLFLSFVMVGQDNGA